MNIFPQITVTPPDITNVQTVLPMFYEYGWDFDNNDFLMVNGKIKIVSGKEAVKVWCWKTLQTPRYKYLAYSWNYGQELDNLRGSSLNTDVKKSEVQRYITEALKVSPYVKNLKNFGISLDSDVLNVKFTIETIYGEVDLNV